MPKLVFIAAIAAVLMVCRIEAREIYIANYCPFPIELEVWVDGERHFYHFERREGGWLSRGDYISTDSRHVYFNARPAIAGQPTAPWLRWQGPQVAYNASSKRHMYRDTFGHVDADFCDEPNSFPWVCSISSGGDAIFPASCADDRASHFRCGGGGLQECPVRRGGLGEAIALLAIAGSVSSARSSRSSPAVPEYIEMTDPRTGSKVSLQFKYGD